MARWENPHEFNAKPTAPGTNPQTGLTQDQTNQWIAQNAPASWGQVSTAVGNLGGLKSQTVNQTLSNAIRSGDAGRVHQVLGAIGLDNVDANELIGHYNTRVNDWNTSDAGKAAMQNFQNVRLANMSREQYLTQVVHPQLRRRYAMMRQMGYTTPHVASRGTVHHINRFRPAFHAIGVNADGSTRFRETDPLEPAPPIPTRWS